jgi:DNA invertase Pin-like site-specific DNA recombinase
VRLQIEGKFIAYLRVSTGKQGIDGLGVDAQKAAIEAYLNGGKWKLLKEYIEQESGKRRLYVDIATGERRPRARPQLAKALEHCRRASATLVIAKLDRLARDVEFVANIMNAGVDFVATDNPHANRLTLHILAAVGEDEARRISERTRDGLASIKRKLKAGKKHVSKAGNRVAQLGNPNGARALEGKRPGNKAAIAVVRLNARRRAENVMEAIEELKRETGATSLHAIATALNERGIATPRGGQWYPASVARVLSRAT